MWVLVQNMHPSIHITITNTISHTCRSQPQSHTSHKWQTIHSWHSHHKTHSKHSQNNVQCNAMLDFLLLSYACGIITTLVKEAQENMKLIDLNTMGNPTTHFHWDETASDTSGLPNFAMILKLMESAWVTWRFQTR